MNVKVGAKIKGLRKRDGITQETLAESLGVTSQAVSRWESENGYPDIEYISPIANFFNVSIDYLFDHDIAEKRKRINEYCKQFDAHRRAGKPPQERLDMIRRAIAEFPAEEQLQFRLAKALYHKWRDYGFYTKMADGYVVSDFEKHRSYDSWEESVKIMEELLASSLDDSIRSECRELLADIYGWIGEKGKVLEIAEKCDDMSRSKQSILANAIHDEDEIKYRQQFLVDLLYTLKVILMDLAKRTGDENVICEAGDVMENLCRLVYDKLRVTVIPDVWR